MTDLPDVNVWLALADENHAFHSTAQHYWQERSATEVAFCRISMLGFLRLSTHRSVLSRPLNPDEAWGAYQRYLSVPQIHFAQEPLTIEDEFKEIVSKPNFPRQLWTDAYLAAFALSSSCRIVTFDKDFEQFPGLKLLRLNR